jgi:PAS domain S-box-containing protein
LLAIVTAFLDRLLAAQKAAFNAAQESELSFRTLAEAIPQMIWTSLPDGQTDYVSRRWCEYTGFDTEQSVGRGWETAIHSEDLPEYLTKWERSLQTGETLETEYRLRRASDRIYRWHLGRAVPVRDSKGKIVKWFGTCTDIDDQKRHQQILEEQIKERTAEVVAVHAQLTEEMREREKSPERIESAEREHGPRTYPASSPGGSTGQDG